MIGNHRFDDLSSGGLPCGHGAVRVLLHKSRISRDISSENRDQPALGGLIPHDLSKTNLTGQFYMKLGGEQSSKEDVCSKVHNVRYGSTTAENTVTNFCLLHPQQQTSNITGWNVCY
jgi:hypothetical protein